MKRSSQQDVRLYRITGSRSSANAAGGFVFPTSGTSVAPSTPDDAISAEDDEEPQRQRRRIIQPARATTSVGASSASNDTSEAFAAPRTTTSFGPWSSSATAEAPRTTTSFTFGSASSAAADPSLPPPSSPVLPPEPLFSSNRKKFQWTLERWVHEAESSLSTYSLKMEKWKEAQKAKSQAEINDMEKQIEQKKREIAHLKLKKGLSERKNKKEITEVGKKAKDLIAKSRQKITDTRGIIKSLSGGDSKPPPTAVSQGALVDLIEDNCKNPSPPSILCCPITLQLMTDPVIVCQDGHTYERCAIMKHWNTQEAQGIPITSPKTNQQIPSKQLAPNVLVRSQCREWLEHHPNYKS